MSAQMLKNIPPSYIVCLGVCQQTGFMQAQIIFIVHDYADISPFYHQIKQLLHLEN